MSDDSAPPRAIDALHDHGSVKVSEVEGVYRPVLYRGSEEFGRLFVAAHALHLIAEGSYLHTQLRAYFAASDHCSFDGDPPPPGVARSEAEVLRKVADIRDPDCEDTWDDYEGES